MEKRTLLIVALFASLLFLIGWTTGHQAARRNWEYKQTCSVKDLNKLGDEGWELTTAASSSNITCYVLKRAK